MTFSNIGASQKVSINALDTGVKNNNISSIDSKSQFSSGLIERSFKYFGAGAALSVFFTTKFMLPFIESTMDYCPAFPKPIYTYVRNACRIREFLPGLRGTYNNTVFKAPIVEEAMFRVGLQEMILKRAPKALLNRFAPSYSGLVDTPTAKIARVALSAAAFSLIHAMPPKYGWPNCSAGRIMNTFVLGLFTGGIQEVTESPLMATIFHSGFNIQPGFLMEQLKISVGCPE